MTISGHCLPPLDIYRNVSVRLSGAAKQELGKGKTLKAKLSGTGITGSTVKIKPAKKKTETYG